MDDDPTRSLTEHERRYLDHLRTYLADVAVRDRRNLLAAAEQNLTERPPTSDFEGLLREIGGPEEYAAGLRSDLDLAAPGSVERSRKRHRRRRTLAMISTAVLIAAAAVGFWRWQTWQAEFTANTSGLCIGAGVPERCDLTGIIDRSNIYGDVKQVMCVPGTKVTLINGIVAHSDVTITGVDLGLPEGFRDIVQLDEVVPWPMRRLAPGLRGNPEPGTWPLSVDLASEETLLYFHLTLNCDPTRYSPGSSIILQQFVVRYHAFGKDREVRMPLQDSLQITYPG